MPEEAARLLHLRGLLTRLAPLGLTEAICREHDVTPGDLELLAWMEDLIEELKPQKGPHG